MVALGDAQQAACEIHGGGFGRAGTSDRMHGSAMQGGAMHDGTGADMATHHGHARSSGGSGEQDSNACSCTCIGDCSVSAPMAAVPTLPTIRVAIISAQPRRRLDVRTSDTPPPSADRRLPFPNGPPATRLS
jgi:hypothetical protein